MSDKRNGEGPPQPRSNICRSDKKQDQDPGTSNITDNKPNTSKMPSNNPIPSKPPSRMPSSTPSEPKTSSKLSSNNTSSSETSQKMLRLETDCAELQKRLQGEVARAVEMWRKGMVQGTLESQNERIISFIKQLEDDKFASKDKSKTSCSILAELNRENDQLRSELEEMRKLDVNDITVERLQELQHDNKNLRAVIAKLQEEVQEKNLVHHRKIRDQQEIIRKSQMNTDSSESAVNKLKVENRELKVKVAELIKSSEEEKCNEVEKTLNCQFCPPFDLIEKLTKAEHRLKVACTELNLKRKHHKKVPTHSVKSLEDIACVWTQHVNLLKLLLKKEKDMNLLKDRLDMFVSNIEILKDENSELSSRLACVREEMKTFRENPMKPTEQVTKNVNLLLHMEKIDGSLAEKAVQLDKNEKDLKREQHRVREILIRVEELRRENRHFTRRLQKDAAKRAYESRSLLSSVAREEDTSSSCSDQLQSINLDPMYGAALEEGDGIGVEPNSDGTDQPYHSEEGSNPPPNCNCQSESDGTDAQYQTGSDATAEPPQEETDTNDFSPQTEIGAPRTKSPDDSQGL